MKSYSSMVIPASADEVWCLLRDFGGVAAWLPVLESSEIEERTDGDAVGAVRAAVLKDGAGTTRERLVALDDIDRTYTYEVVGDIPFAATSYRGTLRVTPLTTTGESFVEWCGLWDADAADAPALNAAITASYAMGLGALHTYFSTATETGSVA